MLNLKIHGITHQRAKKKSTCYGMNCHILPIESERHAINGITSSQTLYKQLLRHNIPACKEEIYKLCLELLQTMPKATTLNPKGMI